MFSDLLWIMISGWLYENCIRLRIQLVQQKARPVLRGINNSDLGTQNVHKYYLVCTEVGID